MHTPIRSQVSRLAPDTYLNKKIAVISDLHSNFDSLSCAVEKIRQHDVDLVVILGDLLSYGAQVDEVLALLKTLAQQLPCWFVMGNHDEFYFDLQSGQSETRYKIPDFIKESVQWNLDKLNQSDVVLLNHFDWHSAIALGPVLLSHANPYGLGNWSYLNQPNECLKAARVLREGDYQVGIFGHTHRKKVLCFIGDELADEPADTLHYKQHPSHCYIVNPGSLGQPRGEGASLLFFQITEHSVALEHITIHPDLTRYFSQLVDSNLSDTTTEKLLSYFGDIK
ncbi:MAG: metallophosphoesterase [Colwellia sp.]|uniref:metallophosphoesterase family protein n=1 Tax=Alteromonadales TaxID=135622 RepID=UPI001DA4EC18|nr:MULTISPECIES: metallophosphoesterase [Alteromonadales]NQZ26979.1 metallophosphoesterase [Colwellia sp.]NRA78636.1 metallophosphoesterase [Pseudoalteromonas sp.]